MNQKFLNFCRTTYHKYEFLQPFLSFIDRKFIFKTRFSGGGMKTEHALPWDDEFNSKEFLQSNNDLRNFRFTKNIANSGEKTADEGAWRHWGALSIFCGSLIWRSAHKHASPFERTCSTDKKAEEHQLGVLL